jgi:plasmid stabilization system protein ParE
VEALSELQGKLAENPRAFPPIKEYRFSVLSRSFRYVVLFRVDEKSRRIRILGIFGPGQRWRPED